MMVTKDKELKAGKREQRRSEVLNENLRLSKEYWLIQFR